VRDDGRGFEVEKDDLKTDHMGLRIMQERAAAIGAAVSVMSTPEAGTQIMVTWGDATKLYLSNNHHS